MRRACRTRLFGIHQYVKNYYPQPSWLTPFGLQTVLPAHGGPCAPPLHDSYESPPRGFPSPCPTHPKGTGYWMDAAPAPSFFHRRLLQCSGRLNICRTTRTSLLRSQNHFFRWTLGNHLYARISSLSCPSTEANTRQLLIYLSSNP